MKPLGVATVGGELFHANGSRECLQAMENRVDQDLGPFPMFSEIMSSWVQNDAS